MYKIIEPQEEFICNGLKWKPIVSFQKDDGSKYNIIVDISDRYIIFKEVSPFDSSTQEGWKIEQCVFDKYFIEVLRLLPENPKDLAILNQDYYKQMLELWQQEENFTLDKTLLEFEELTRKIEEQTNEKKGD